MWKRSEWLRGFGGERWVKRCFPSDTGIALAVSYGGRTVRASSLECGGGTDSEVDAELGPDIGSARSQ
jgi:hypothetical protein